MNPTVILNVFITALLAIILYFVLPMVAADISNDVAIVIGVISGGLFVPFLSQAFTSALNASDDEDSSADMATLYVGNLPYRANEEAVQEHFAQQGKVISVRLMKDRRTGKRKGYGFVEMNAKGAAKAIKNLNDSTFQERTLKVRLAKEKVESE